MNLLAFDQSMRGFAYAALPLDWGGDWTKLRTGVFDGGKVPRKSTDEVIWARTSRVISFALDQIPLRPALIGFESYGFSAKPQLDVVECVGVLKAYIDRYDGVTWRTVNQSSARKLLLGKVPRRGDDAKAAVQAALINAGGPGVTLDECDAFCVLNFMLNDLGGYSFAQSG